MDRLRNVSIGRIGCLMFSRSSRRCSLQVVSSVSDKMQYVAYNVSPSMRAALYAGTGQPDAAFARTPYCSERSCLAAREFEAELSCAFASVLISEQQSSSPTGSILNPWGLPPPGVCEKVSDYHAACPSYASSSESTLSKATLTAFSRPFNGTLILIRLEQTRTITPGMC
jgi:hypothetical protein